ncbi:MAG: secondary thiamine-phosphate synthase enzyme YjbQ [Syntrophorhabdaceae bacterium]|nr:secondary thiamine-phosphate synthase enzyme YjbQ [Syntrophorhabdales bacterium]MBP9560614.1 secondary thiamine-phosphate synthase enzyme YjbQ [Syntrophorhabdaceae bacterium]
MIHTDTIRLETKGFNDTIDITERVIKISRESGIEDGLITIFCPGSTGTITTIEFESGVIRDLKNALERIVPSNMAYEHDYRWGDGNGFSHVRAALMKPALSIPLIGGSLTLGTWQQIVFIDFDNRGRHRGIVVQVMGT